MKALFSVVFLLPFLAQAEISRDFVLKVEGERSSSLAQAKISYLNSCSRVREELQASGLAAFVKTASCSDFSVQEGPTLFRATGGLSVHLKRAMRIDSADLATGFVDTESEAQQLWGQLCTEWKSQSAEPAKVVLETCGQPKLDLFYVKPELSSRAIRVAKVRIESQRGEFCHCRTRSVERIVETPWGQRPEWVTVFDLMALVDAGYYESQGTFSSAEECHDLLVKSPLCSTED